MLFVADELIRTYLVDSESNEVTLICDGEGLSIRHSLIRTPSRVMKMMDLLLVKYGFGLIDQVFVKKFSSRYE